MLAAEGIRFSPPLDLRIIKPPVLCQFHAAAHINVAGKQNEYEWQGG